MKTRFLQFLLSFFVTLITIEGYAGGYIVSRINVPASPSLPYHAKVKFTVEIANVTNTDYFQGKWYIHLKCNNPAVTIQDFYNTTAPGIGSIPVRADEFYQLPDIVGTYIGKSHTIELDLQYDSLAGYPTTANLGIALYYIGNAKDSVVIDANGDPFQYYCDTSVSFRQFHDKQQSILTFLPGSITNFADYTVTPTATACDTIQYVIEEKGKGYSTLSDFSFQTTLPSGFRYIANSAQVQMRNNSNNPWLTPMIITPTIQHDTILLWNLNSAGVGAINNHLQDSTKSFTLRFKILSRAGYTRDSISGVVSATKSSGGVIQKNIPWMILDPSSQPSPITQTLPNTITLIEGDTLVLSVNTQNTSYSYIWQKNNLNLTGSSSKDFSRTNVLQADSGEYRCLVYNNCHQVATNTTIVKINKVVTIPEDPEDNNEEPEDSEENVTTKISYGKTSQTLSVYPNPSTGILYLNNISSAFYTISNLTGTTIQQGSINPDGSINLQSIPTGIYFLQIREGNTIQSVKIFKN